MDPLFEIKVKQAFSKVKEDIDTLKTEISEIKELFQEFINKVSPHLKTKSPEKANEFGVSGKNQLEDKKTSIGNKGVYSLTHSLTHSPFTRLNPLNIHSHKQSQNLPNQTLAFENLPTQNAQIPINNLVPHPLQTLTNKEFLVFLTIYQLEKELPKVTYEIIAKKLTLTSGCIRSYVASIIRKKAPLIRSKLNNKLTLLSIDTSFRSLTSEQKLIDLYYQNDPSQTTL